MHNGSASDFGSESIGSIPASPAKIKNMEEKELIDSYKIRMDESILLVKNILEDLRKNGHTDGIKYPKLCQVTLNWLDDLNFLSVVI